MRIAVFCIALLPSTLSLANAAGAPTRMEWKVNGVTREALVCAQAAGATTILNPAPAIGIDRSIFGLADIVTPNRTEVATLLQTEAQRTGRTRTILPGDVTRDEDLVALTQSLLGPYTKAIAVYRCPSDPGKPAGTPRVRSISMNGFMNGLGGGTVPGFKNFTKSTELSVNGGPSQWFVFLDEKPISINDEYFEVRMAQATPVSITMNDWPSQVHDRACGFGFADGHSEIHKWKGPSMSSPTTVGAVSYTKPSADFNDAYWLTSHTTYATPNQ